ncbi:MAG: hypothetical protein HC892_22500 [Saprospiraceae bacterium]|nr:hypothetical protein [Saprospiraceae bacterium]
MKIKGLFILFLTLFLFAQQYASGQGTTPPGRLLERTYYYPDSLRTPGTLASFFPFLIPSENT